MNKEFDYIDEKVYVVKFITNFGTFEFDLDFVKDTQEQTLQLLQLFRKQSFS